jgi:hypothetical protein
MMSKESQIALSRRDMLRGLAMTGCACLAMTIGRVPKVSCKTVNDEGDISILLAALYLEHEAIAAYETGALTGLLPVGLLNIAIPFQSDHKYHRDGIVKTIEDLGGEAFGSNEKYQFGNFKTAKDVLRFAIKYEQGAVSAYSTLASNIKNKAVLNFAANVLVDEVRHATVLRSVSL